MSFKDIVQQDLDNIIFNTEEFAEVHTIDGKQLKVAVDNDALMERSKKEYDGISVGEILYFVKALDFGELPEEGTPQAFDGRMMYVFNAREDDGIYEIILRQNRGE
jgi:hypothetical protein